MNQISSPKRPPAGRCCGCERRLEEIGGDRILAEADLLGEHPLDESRLPSGEAVGLVMEMLEGRRPIRVVGRNWALIPEDRRPAVARRAAEDRLEGKEAWICQPCVRDVCPVCETPYRLPRGWRIVGEDGAISYASGFMSWMIGCRNPACRNHRGHT